jgi:hypothetical protein
MPNDYKHVHKQRVESGQAKDNSKIVIEGVDEPKKPEPRPTVMDPWSSDYPYRAGHPDEVKST